MHDSEDNSQRFMFDNTDVRGELVSLRDSYAHVLAKHPYPEPVAQLLGEVLAAAALLVGTLKFDGMLILQARSNGAVPLLMVECTSERELRGIARYHAEQIGEHPTLADLMPEGVLALTVEPTNGQRYQGIVSLDGENFAACLNTYFESSEQLPTRFWLNADGRHARGFLLQQLPVEHIKDLQAREENWQHLTVLAQTLTAEEQLALDNPTLLHRLYHEEQVRLFEPRPLVFRCSCSRERSAQALVSLGQADAEALIEEQGGSISINCQFCNANYRFDAADVSQLFAGGGSSAPSATRH